MNEPDKREIYLSKAAEIQMKQVTDALANIASQLAETNKLLKAIVDQQKK